MPSGRAKGGNTMDPPVTAGQGGHVIQLEKPGLAIEVHRWLPKPLHQIPEDEPVNDMAPAPHWTKKATHKVTRESKNGGLSTPPQYVPSDQSSQLPVSQDERPTMPEGVLQNSLTSCPSVTQLNPTAHPQSGRSHAPFEPLKDYQWPLHHALQPTRFYLKTNLLCLCLQRMSSINPVVHCHFQALPRCFSLPTMRMITLKTGYFIQQIWMNGLKTTSINLIINDVNYENSDTSKRKKMKLQGMMMWMITLMTIQMTNSELRDHDACSPAELITDIDPPCPRVISPARLFDSKSSSSSYFYPVFSAAAPSPCSGLSSHVAAASPIFTPNQLGVQALQMVTGVTIVKLNHPGDEDLPKLKKQCTSTEDELCLEEDNSEVMPGTPKLTGQGHHANVLEESQRPRCNSMFALEEPVPQHEVAIQGQCSEILFEVLAHYEEKNLEVKASYYPWYKLDMAKLIFADTHTFHSEIKKAAIQIIPAQYQLFPLQVPQLRQTITEQSKSGQKRF
ncbi:hypothetical protein F5141DRAFT_1070987 [Pisolithus sp. B1]|nr:hypothetical protein F5141DRAFT_1070987 [Pisolithus sp. B1]